MAPTLLGFFDVGDALRCLVSELPEEDRKAPRVPPTRNVLSWMKVLEAVEKRVITKPLISVRWCESTSVDPLVDKRLDSKRERLKKESPVCGFEPFLLAFRIKFV